MSRDEVTILDILRAARRAVAFKHGMRDTLIHEYDEVDLEEVWKTVTVHGSMDAENHEG
jgi:uncharacterized protein with HEPN domain